MVFDEKTLPVFPARVVNSSSSPRPLKSFTSMGLTESPDNGNTTLSQRQSVADIGTKPVQEGPSAPAAAVETVGTRVPGTVRQPHPDSDAGGCLRLLQDAANFDSLPSKKQHPALHAFGKEFVAVRKNMLLSSEVTEAQKQQVADAVFGAIQRDRLDPTAQIRQAFDWAVEGKSWEEAREAEQQRRLKALEDKMKADKAREVRADARQKDVKEWLARHFAYPQDPDLDFHYEVEEGASEIEESMARTKACWAWVLKQERKRDQSTRALVNVNAAPTAEKRSLRTADERRAIQRYEDEIADAVDPPEPASSKSNGETSRPWPALTGIKIVPLLSRDGKDTAAKPCRKRSRVDPDEGVGAEAAERPRKRKAAAQTTQPLQQEATKEIGQGAISASQPKSRRVLRLNLPATSAALDSSEDSVASGSGSVAAPQPAPQLYSALTTPSAGGFDMDKFHAEMLARDQARAAKQAKK